MEVAVQMSALHLWSTELQPKSKGSSVGEEMLFQWCQENWIHMQEAGLDKDLANVFD
jgi:hypothetical protein